MGLIALFIKSFPDDETFVIIHMFTICDSPIAGAADCAQSDGDGLLGGVYV